MLHIRTLECDPVLLYSFGIHESILSRLVSMSGGFVNLTYGFLKGVLLDGLVGISKVRPSVTSASLRVKPKRIRYSGWRVLVVLYR